MKTTGSSSRMAVLRSPLASRGVAGVQTLSPGKLAYKHSVAWECVAPNWCAGPLGPRKVIGILNCPPDIVSIEPRYRGYEFAVVEDQVYIVEPRTKKVVDVIREPGSSMPTSGRPGSSLPSFTPRAPIRIRTARTAGSGPG